jgi:hypothetical protein
MIFSGCQPQAKEFFFFAFIVARVPFFVGMLAG